MQSPSPNPAVKRDAGYAAVLRGKKRGQKKRGQTPIFDAVNGKDVLGEIDSYRDNAHGLPLSWFQMDDFDITILALRCRAVLSPLPRDGEVPFIR
jgi:hypothetical protein